MTDERDILLREYALSAGAEDDRRLRDALDQACPDCSQELAEAEADLAAFALDLAPVAPSAGGRERVLARIRAERAAVAAPVAAPEPAATAPTPGPNRPLATRPPAASAAPAPRRVAPGVLAALALILVMVVLGAFTARQDARMEAMSRQVAELAQSQRASTARADEFMDRLERAPHLAKRLRETEKQLEDAAAKLAIMRSSDLSVVALGGTEAQPGAKGRLLYDKSKQRWLLSMSNLAQPVSGRCYELWFITRDGRKIGSQTFTPSADGVAEMMVDVPAGLDVTVAAITDEPLGGVAVPTGQIHLVGTL